MKLERLDKLLAAQSSALSRRDVKEMVRRGRITLDGSPARSADQKIDPGCVRVAVDGQPVTLLKHIYLMLNKPRGVVSASRDSRDQTVIDLVPEELRRDGLFPAGRLDRDTTGFVLITDDGAFAHRILSPKKHVPKTYLADLDGPLDETMQGQFAAGVALDGGTVCRPALLRQLGPCRAQVVLTEGMYHQIKRMFARCGRQVVALRRVRMGALWLDPALAPGECRSLTPSELEQIVILPEDDVIPEAIL